MLAGKSNLSYSGYVNLNLLTADLLLGKTVLPEPLQHLVNELIQDQVKILVTIYQCVVKIENNLLFGSQLMRHS
ncbi:hypothetical protein D3C78_1932980 [compost metagenome]